MTNICVDWNEHNILLAPCVFLSSSSLCHRWGRETDFNLSDPRMIISHENRLIPTSLSPWLDLRASPRVCQILLGKSCVLPSSKKVCQVKKSSSPTIWHNSLAKPRSNLIQDSWKKQNYVYAFPPLGNLHQESFSILYFFFHPPT
jgi:hypothetical protein